MTNTSAKELEEHVRQEHPRRVQWIVRNLTGTAFMCCIGDCTWSVGL